MKSWGENKRAEVKSVQATGKRANINGTEEVASNRGSRDRVRMRHTPNEKRQSKTERRLPLHLYISLEPINLWNWILAMKEREKERGSSATSGNHNEGCSSMEKRSEKENDETLLSLCDICPLNRISSAEQNSEEWYRVKGRKRGWQRKHNREETGGIKGNRMGMNDSKEEKSDRMGRALPASHCFTSRCTEEENLSYASAFHIAFTIYVLAGIMQLDGSVEKTPINLVLFSISSCRSLPLSLSQHPSDSLGARLLWSILPDFLCKGIQLKAFVSCI